MRLLVPVALLALAGCRQNQTAAFPPVIPPRAELIFDVELMAVADTVARANPAPGSQPRPSWATVSAQ